VHVSRDIHDSQWDDFVANCPDGHYEQSSLWGQVRSFYGWKPIRIIVSDNTKIVGGFQILERYVKGMIKIGYVLRGPLTYCEDRELQCFIVSELDRLAKNLGYFCLILVPAYGGHSFVPLFKDLDFIPKPTFLPPTGLLQASLMLDLSDSIDQIFAKMRKTKKKNIRKGYREGISVREGTGADVELFRRLANAMCERRGVAPTPPQRDFFQNLWQVFHPHGCVKLFLVEFDNKPISASLVITFGNIARSWKVGSTGEHLEKNPNDVRNWEAIKWAKENGFRYFEIMGLELNCAVAMREGKVISSNSTDGMSFFKIGFGGEPVIVPESLCKFYSLLTRIFLWFGGEKILASKRFSQIVIKHFNRVQGTE